MIQNAHEPSALKILVADDTEAAALMLGKLLEVMGHRSRVAHDGVEALEQFIAEMPDLVISDIGMPRMDGYELAQRIRALPATQNVYLVALTGHNDENDKVRAKEAGFDRHLAKPVGLDMLEDLLNSLSSRAV